MLATSVCADDIDALQQNCVACHGGVKDGMKTVKGKFDITPLLRSGLQERHTARWVDVIRQIREKEMPPDDSKYKLSDEQRKAVTDLVYAKLARSDIQERLLTPFEISNTYGKLFGLDMDIYDPFEKLYFMENPDSVYPTINSASLMSAAYVREIESGLDLTLDRTVANGFGRIAAVNKKYRDVKAFELRVLMTGTSKDRSPAVYLAFVNPPKLPIDGDTLKSTTDQEERNKLKEKNGKANKAYLANVWATQDTDLMDLRMRGATRLSSKQYGINLPQGRYRLTFTASALNRDLVKQVTDNSKKGKTKGLSEFRELYDSKAGIAIRHGGVNKSRRGSLAAGTKKGKLLHYFEIEDKLKKEYSCEFELTVPGQIEIDFVNGPWNSRIDRMNLGGVGKQAAKAEDYALPCIRIYTKLILEPIAPPKPTSAYQILADESEARLKQKLQGLIAELSLDANTASLLAVHDKLAKTLSPEQRYVQALKWIAMSQDQLYVRYSKDDPIASARYLSYALLKKHPSASFKADYTRFRAGQFSARDLAQRVVSDPSFEDFLAIFMKHWLKNRTELDEKKFPLIDLGLPFKQETSDYLKHLFAENRPVSELFVSDYRMLTAPMARFYGLKANGLDRHEPRRVEAPGKGGLLHQANFFVARSDGVDPRPFSRAEWVVENAFAHRLSEPPGNINADLFIAKVETLSFEERTKVHRQNKSCYSCHKLLDPIAFAVNDYDTIGRMTGKPNLDAKRSLSEKLSKADETMARSFCKNLIAYTIGRDTNIYDMKTIDQIVAKTAKNGYPVRDILAEILERYFKK